MAKDCLFTSLKGSINNPSVKRVGEFDIHIPAGIRVSINRNNFLKNVYIWLKSGSATASSGGSSVDLPYTLTTGIISITAVAESIIGVQSVYNMKILELSGATASKDWDIDVKAFEYAPLTYVSLNLVKYIHGDIKYLYKLGNTNTIINLGTNPINGFLIGDISVLGNCLSLTEIQLNFQNGVGGALEGLVAKYVKNGKTTGSLTISLAGNNQFSFNNVGIASAANNKTLSWAPNGTDATNTDVTYDSTTITIDADDWEV